MAEYDIAVIGGDRRTAFMIPFFQENGYRVISFGIQETDKENADGRAHSLKEALDGADVIVGGIPLEKEGVLEIRELSRLIRKKHTIFGVSFRNRSGRNAVKGISFAVILCWWKALPCSMRLQQRKARCWKRCGIRIPIYTKAKALSSVMADAEKY